MKPSKQEQRVVSQFPTMEGCHHAELHRHKCAGCCCLYIRESGGDLYLYALIGWHCTVDLTRAGHSHSVAATENTVWTRNAVCDARCQTTYCHWNLMSCSTVHAGVCVLMHAHVRPHTRARVHARTEHCMSVILRHATVQCWGWYVSTLYCSMWWDVVSQETSRHCSGGIPSD